MEHHDVTTTAGKKKMFWLFSAIAINTGKIIEQSSMRQSQKYGSLLRFRIKENGGKFEFLISDEKCRNHRPHVYTSATAPEKCNKRKDLDAQNKITKDTIKN